MRITLALTGFGNVGRGIATLLQRHGKDYQRRYGLELVLAGVADRGGAVVSPGGIDLAAALEAKRTAGTVAAAPGGEFGLAGDDFLQRARSDMLLETASTNFQDAEPGWSYTRSALARGLDVVFASKGVLVLHYDEVMRSAADKGARVRFSATVGAPLPVFELSDRALVGAEITGFEGVLNSTSNAILSAMSQGSTYEEGVRSAQEMGIAETDPTLDVDGWDAAAKSVIVARAALGASLSLEQVAREGIRGVTRDDLDAAATRGEVIKLVSRVSLDDDRVIATVRPEARPPTDALGRLQGGDLGIVFHTLPLGAMSAAIGDAEGLPTGGIPTAMTVLRDVINLGRERA